MCSHSRVRRTYGCIDILCTERSEMTLNIFTASRAIHFPNKHDKIISFSVPGQQPLYTNAPTAASYTVSRRIMCIVINCHRSV